MQLWELRLEAIAYRLEAIVSSYHYYYYYYYY